MMSDIVSSDSPPTVSIRLFGGPADGEVVDFREWRVSQLESYLHREIAPRGISFSEKVYEYRACPYCTEEGHKAVAYIHEGKIGPHEDDVAQHIGDGVPIIQRDAFDMSPQR